MNRKNTLNISVFFTCILVCTCIACGKSEEEQNTLNQELLSGARISYKQRSLNAVEKALKKGAEPEAKDEKGRTPMHWAAYYKHIRILRKLRQYEAPLESKAKDGQTPLHYAADNQYLEEIRPLLNSNMQPRRAIPRHDSPLFNKQEYIASVRFLLKEGADPNAEDTFGNTVLDIVNMRDNIPEKITGLLKEHGAKTNAEDMNFEL